MKRNLKVTHRPAPPCKKPAVLLLIDGLGNLTGSPQQFLIEMSLPDPRDSRRGLNAYATIESNPPYPCCSFTYKSNAIPVTSFDQLSSRNYMSTTRKFQVARAVFTCSGKIQSFYWKVPRTYENCADTENKTADKTKFQCPFYGWCRTHRPPPSSKIKITASAPAAVPAASVRR